MFGLLDIIHTARRVASRPRWLTRSLSVLALAAVCLLLLGSPLPLHAGEQTSTRRAAGAPSVNPLATLQRDTRDSEPSVGRVEQRLAAGSYSYLALRLDDGELRWLVTLGKGESVGTRVRSRSFGHRTDFYSRRLQRTFPVLAFGFVSQLD